MVKVSVIVPVYNVEKYIKACVESLCAQSLKELEIILVDDGSPDNCGRICDEYAAKDSRIRVLHKPNGGVSAARNDGLRMATGEYVVFVDSDDYVPADAYEKLYSKAAASGADLVWGDMHRVYDDGRETYTSFFDKEFVTRDRALINQMIQADFYNTYCSFSGQGGPAFGYGSPCNKLIRRSLLQENNVHFDLRVKGIFDDIIFVANTLAVAECVAYVPVSVYCYRIIGTSITRTYKKNMLEINEAIFSVWEEFLEKYNGTHEFDKPYYANVIRRLEHAITHYFFSDNNPKPKSIACKELKQTIISEPYRTAALNVDMSKLARRHKVLAMLVQKRFVFGIYLFQKMQSMRRK